MDSEGWENYEGSQDEEGDRERRSDTSLARCWTRGVGWADEGLKRG